MVAPQRTGMSRSVLIRTGFILFAPGYVWSDHQTNVGCGTHGIAGWFSVHRHGFYQLHGPAIRGICVLATAHFEESGIDYRDLSDRSS